MSLLDEIAALGDEAFIAWEKYSEEHPLDFDALNISALPTAKVEPYIYPIRGITFASEDSNLIFDAIYMCGRYMAAFVPGSNIWIGRKPNRNDGGYSLFQDCKFALAEYKDAQSK